MASLIAVGYICTAMIQDVEPGAWGLTSHCEQILWSCVIGMG